MATGSLTPDPKVQWLDNGGLPVAGGKVFTYTAGTSVKRNTYSDSALTTPNANPVVLDSSGRATIYLDSNAYKIIFSPANDTDPPTNPYWTQDNVQSIAGIDVTAYLKGTADLGQKFRFLNEGLVTDLGICVGFNGTPAAGAEIDVGDANFSQVYVSSTDVRWRGDSTDYLKYDRTNNAYLFVVGTTTEAQIDASGLQVTDGINVGFAAAPVAARVAIGDATCFFQNLAGTQTIEFDTNDTLTFTRATNLLQVVIASSGGAGFSSFGSFGAYGANVTAAAAIVPTGNVFHVTGNTNITSITSTGIPAGTVITIIFDGTPTFTDGSNLKLAGNLVATADDTITLAYDGSFWNEMARSIN